MRRSFDRAAQTYDDAAALAREIADRMLERLDLLQALVPQRATRSRQRHRILCAQDCAAAIRIAHGRRARLRHGDAAARPQSPIRGGDAALALLTGEHASAVCADMERLPFADRASTWCGRTSRCIGSTRRSRSLPKLARAASRRRLHVQHARSGHAEGTARAYARGRSRAHVNRFIDMHDIGDMLVHARFADPVMDMEYITLTYARCRVRCCAN